ncbi:MAG: RMD1 family protein [Caedimonas sp.]|nr:RMD1 family protein [Caedimonas sp.]
MIKMRCSAYCTAGSYDLQGLLNNFRERASAMLYEGSLHLKLNAGEAFFFTFGSSVFWRLSNEEEDGILNELRDFEKDPLAKAEVDTFSFDYGKPAKVFQDQIILEDPQDVLGMLSVSHGLAQSIKLETSKNQQILRHGERIQELISIFRFFFRLYRPISVEDLRE